MAVATPATLLDRRRFEQSLAAADAGIAAVRALLEEAFGRLDSAFDSGVPVEALVHERAWIVDTLLRDTWARQGFPEGEVTLLAAGGYGRGELHPCSDVDLAIVLNRRHSPGVRTRIEAFLTFLWDIGLKIGSSVRSVRECRQTAKQDITVVTTLMEIRLLAGSTTLFEQVRDAVSPDHMWP